MDEILLGAEATEELNEALGEWGDDPVDTDSFDDVEEVSETETEAADQPDSEEDEDAQETEAEEESVEETSEEDNITAFEEAKKNEAADQRFTLKHLDEVKDVGRDEVIALAQKGMDYDRIRSERDTLKAQQAEKGRYESFLQELADMSGKTIEELIIDTKARIVLDEETKKGYNITKEQARYRVESEMRAAKKAQPTAPVQEETVAETPAPVMDSKALRDANFKEFVNAYPEVKGSDIPSEVWKEFGDGTSKKLVDIYARYENKRLRAEIQDLKKQANKKPRSTGSRKSNSIPSEYSDEDIFAGW